MARVKYIPCRGDIVWIDFDPTKGHEQSGRRPAMVVSLDAYNAISGRALFCPITSKIKGHVFDVLYEGEKVKGVILADQVRTMDWSKRDLVFVEKAPPAVADDVEGKLLTLIQG
ncbi:MAG: type II toxin-antitoxin system PemK/MazF family toxin [Patescibacteria group bacterium]